MATAESRRHDLYNGLTEFLGEDRANTLMTYLPAQESTDLATKADLDALETAVTDRFDMVDQRFLAMDRPFEAINHRLDRMVFALVAGLVAIIATLVAQSFI
jgi:hypothetical protein